MYKPDSNTTFAECMKVNRSIIQIMKKPELAAAAQTVLGPGCKDKCHRNPRGRHVWEVCDKKNRHKGT